MTDQAQDSNSSEPGDGDSKNPMDQLVDLLLYAPVGLAYEYEDVLPKLIKRGKSQVQLAKVLSQMAAQQGQTKAKQAASEGSDGVEDALAEVLGQAASVLAKGITDFGQRVGLAPVAPSDPQATDSAQASTRESSTRESSTGESSDSDASSDAATGEEPSVGLYSGAVASPAGSMPMAGYNELKAREIVPMLGDLTADQRRRVRAYEEATRGRKTILGKLDKLEQ